MIRATCAHSHLFPGARLVTDRAVEPDVVGITFADGVTVDAELLVHTHDLDQLLLDVPGHRTAAGTAVPARTWRAVADDAEHVRITERAM